MSWLLFIILAYLFLAVVSLFDRYFLVGSIPNAKVYTFNAAILWLFFCLFLIPFGAASGQLNAEIMFLGMASGLARILAILFLTKGIIKSEVSRVVPAIGGFLPVFSFVIFSLFFPGSEVLNFFQISAFILLLTGSVFISFKKNNREFFNFSSLKYPVASAFLFALSFFLTKKLFLETDFLNGLFLTLLGGGLGGISFLLFPKVRKEIFTQKFNQKISGLFFLGQIFGGAGVIFQFYAVFLARPAQVPLINALEGIRFVFLLFFVFFLSRWDEKLLKEEMAGTNLFQKIIAILLIGGGLAILAVRI